MADRWGLRMFHRVTELEVAGDQYTDETVERLRELNHLERLFLSKTRVSNAWIEQFQSQHPECKVSVIAAM